ncbi:MAG: hypothetical protein GTO02_02085, partial [Candidatus Dadabacteria bacterium]|nr:hypothetical protein [Candidatus Dadabacteria bacterium]NIQ13226.1 hypothetical protein [Candidatus Dadabacteria bacterium]
NVLTAYYDLRNRNTFLQITSPDLDSLGTNTTIHVQIFQHDRDCDELDFFDTLTPNDTVVYDLDNIKKNDGSPVAITLNDNSYGYVVISAVTTNPINLDDSRTLLGNFRIIDDAG